VPFPGENFVAVAMRHINEEPPSIRAKRPDVSPRVEAAVHRAMAKDPEARFQTMAEFCQELEACLAEEQGTQVIAPVVRPRRQARAPRRGMSPWPLILVLISLIAIGAVVAYLAVHGAPNWGASGGGGTGGTGAAPHLKAVAAYDPFGTGGENDAMVKLATDGVGSTAWSTEQYYNAPSLNKPGVGIVFDAGRDVQLHRFAIASATPGFNAVIRGGSSPAGPFPAYLSTPQVVGSATQIAITVGAHRYYLIWITRLGPGHNTALINEVSAN